MDITYIQLIIIALVGIAVFPLYKQMQRNTETLNTLDKKLSLEIKEAQLRIKVLENEVWK